jgi:hypothetical protein
MILSSIGIIDSINRSPNIDEYLPAKALYSLRKVRSAYTGNAIRIRRSTDNAEFNIGFDANGVLDTAAIQTHIGANSATVFRWYDQSGNGFDFENSTASEQPAIYTSGSMLTRNGLPTTRWNLDMLWNGSNTLFSTPDLFISAVVYPDNITTIQGMLTSRQRGYDVSPAMNFQTTNSPQITMTSNSCNWGNINTPVLFVYAAEWDEGVNMQIWKDNVLRSAGNCTTRAAWEFVGSDVALGTTRMTNSTDYDAPTFKGDISEILVWDTLQDNLGNRTGIYTNQRNYYSIT